MTMVEWSLKEHVTTSSLWCMDLFYLDLVVLRLKLWSQCITGVISGSELDDPEFSAPQPCAWKDHGVVKTTDHYDDVPSNDDADEGSVLVNMAKKGIKRTQRNQVCFQQHCDNYMRMKLNDVQADARSSQPNAPSSKRAKTHRNTFGTQHSGSGANNKYINSDLPAGSTNDNL